MVVDPVVTAKPGVVLTFRSAYEPGTDESGVKQRPLVVAEQKSEPSAMVAAMDDVPQAVRPEAWTQADLSLLQQANTLEMMAHLGGPETEEKLLDRHRRYLQRDDPGAGQMFAIVLEDGQRVGVIGFWSEPGTTNWYMRRAGTSCRPSRDAA